MIVVTGGAGFIGSNIVKGLNEKGISDILIVDEYTQSVNNLHSLKFIDFESKDKFYNGIQNKKYGKIDAVFHQGACSNTLNENVEYMISNNFDYSKNLLNFAVNEGVPFIYASSASVYGTGDKGFRENPMCEKSINLYALSKLMFDQHVRYTMKHARSQIVGLRYFNVYGPQESHKGNMASMVYKIYTQIKDRGYVELFGAANGIEKGEQKRDFIYVKDVVKINLAFWEEQLKSGIYNCGTGISCSFNTVADTIINKMGKGEIKYIDFPEKIREFYQEYTQADLTMLQTAGYTDEFYTIQDGIDEYLNTLIHK